MVATEMGEGAFDNRGCRRWPVASSQPEVKLQGPPV